MKKTKFSNLYKIIAVACLILFALILISSLIDIGSKFREAPIFGEYGIYVEILFYVLVALLVIICIIRPITIIVKSPSLSVVTADKPLDNNAIQIYKRVAKNIIANNNLPAEQVSLLKNYHNNEELLTNLQFVFDQSIKHDLNKIIIANARSVMVSTAIIQNANFDMAAVFAVNLKMIKEIVEKCGYRPSMINLSKLTTKIFFISLVASGLENVSLEDVLPKNALEVFDKVPFLDKIVESTTQGVANALMTLRIGCVARKYLFNDGKVLTQEDIRKVAYKETLKLIPEVIADSITFFPKKIVKFFKKENNTNKDEQLLTEGA